MRRIAKPVHADASPYKAMLLPSCSLPRLYLTTHFHAMPSLGVASRCPAAAFQNIAALIYTLPSPSFAVRRSALPSQGLAELSLCPSRTVLHSALTTPYGAVLCRSSGARSLAIALQREASRSRCETRQFTALPPLCPSPQSPCLSQHSLTMPLPCVTVALARTASPPQSYSLLRFAVASRSLALPSRC